MNPHLLISVSRYNTYESTILCTSSHFSKWGVIAPICASALPTCPTPDASGLASRVIIDYDYPQHRHLRPLDPGGPQPTLGPELSWGMINPLCHDASPPHLV